jgi:hypothetical protein
VKLQFPPGEESTAQGWVLLTELRDLIFFFLVLEIEPRAWSRPGKGSTT